MNEPVWITIEVVSALHERQLAEHGGLEAVRDAGLLESALARPQQLFAYSEPDLCAMASAYAFGLVKNHPFVDGNKRTAYVTMRVFLLRNGRNLTASRAQRYQAIVSLAAGERTEESFADWLREHSRVGTP